MKVSKIIFLATLFFSVTIFSNAFAQPLTVNSSGAEQNTLSIQCGTGMGSLTGAGSTAVNCSDGAKQLIVTAPTGTCTACINDNALVSGTFPCGTASGSTFALAPSSSWTAGGGATNCGGSPAPTGGLVAPTHVQATGSGQSVSVTWTTTTGGIPPYTYTVTATPNQPDSGSPIAESDATSPTVLSGIQINVNYSITVTATDSAKPSNSATSAAVTYSSIPAAPSSGIPSPSAAQTSIFNQFGVGANINSHYESDSFNSIYYAFLQNDVNQLGTAGFKTLRAYSLSKQTYIALINAISNYNQQYPGNKINLVYQFSLCKSDAYHQQADGSNTCIDIAKGTDGWTSVDQIVSAETAKLNGVIQAVGPNTFASVVPMIIVSNEDLIISHGFNYAGDKPVAYTKGQGEYQKTGKYNDTDITNALSTVQGIISSHGALQNIPLSADLVVFNPKYADAATSTAFKNVITYQYHTGPVLMNIYPYQFGAGNPDGTNAVCPHGGANHPSCITQVNALYSLVDALLTTTDQTILNTLQQKGFMLGETGWPNAGTPSPNEYMTMVPGSVAGTQNYIKDVITFANNYSIPVLLFEGYDEPKKAAPSDPESHYGLFSWNNDPWITINQNNININAANKGENNPYHFSPADYTLIYPTNDVNGTVTVTAKSNGHKSVYSFQGPSVTGFKRADGDTIQIKITSSPCTSTTAMYCDATFSKTSDTYTASGSCANPALSGISWNSTSASKAIKSSINLAVPTETMCTGLAPTPGDIQFTIYATGSGSFQSGSGPSTNFNGPTPQMVQVKDGDTVTLTSNCSGGGSLICTGTYSKATGQISNIAETSPNAASAASGGGDCGDTNSGIQWTSPANTLHLGSPASSACSAN